MIVTLIILSALFVASVAFFIAAKAAFNEAMDIHRSIDKSIEILNKTDRKKYVKVELTCSSSVSSYLARKRMASRIGYAIRRELNGDFFKKYQDGDNVTYVSSFYITPKND